MKKSFLLAAFFAVCAVNISAMDYYVRPFTEGSTIVGISNDQDDLINHSMLDGLSKNDVALIREALHLQSVLGRSIWPNWNSSKTPFLYKTPGYDFLINHPKPPADFKPFNDKLWGAEIMVRANKDTFSYRAAYPIEGIITVVVSAPKKEEDPCSWVLMAAHELFHIYQGFDRSVANPFIGKYSNYHELSFPFDYKNKNILAGCGIEAELLVNLVTKNIINSGDSVVSKKVFNRMQTIFSAIITDSLQIKYKQWMEWLEGVAKYTEYKLAYLAGSPSGYKPSKEFSDTFPDASYADLWTKSYAGQISPIRFVGEGVSGSMMFYYTGIGKALVLDKIQPDWKMRYFKKNLDALIAERSELTKCETK